MSYIRCVSNPEKLYIVGGHSCTEFYGPGDPVYMPSEVFEGLLRKYVREDCEEGSAEGNEVYKLEKATLKFLAPPEQMQTYGKSSGDDWKWFLHYEGWAKPIEMWDVTLSYIASRFSTEYDIELYLERQGIETDRQEEEN